MNKTSLAIDRSAIAVSTFCLVHCLVLPVVVTSLPVFGVLSESEWIHRLFVMIAIPLSLIAFLAPLELRYRNIMRAMALIGVSLLALSAFVEPFHEYETLLTGFGAMLVGAAHMCRIIFRRHDHAH